MPVRTGLFPWNISSFAPSEIPSREILLSNSKARADASCSIELILPMEICMLLHINLKLLYVYSGDTGILQSTL